MLLAWGRSHRTTTDGELIRWGDRPGPGRRRRSGATPIEVAIVRAGATGSAGRKRIRVNGLGRRATGLAGLLRIVLFAPEEMLLIAGSPSLRRAVLDQLASTSSPAYADAFTTYGRTLQQRNSLLRAIREEGASRDELRFWDGAFLDAGAAIVAERRRLLEVLSGPAGGGPRRDRPGGGGRRPPDAPLRDERAATPRGVAAGRARPAPRRDRREGGLERLDARSGRTATTWSSSSMAGDLASFASRGQQRTAILALKLAELDVADGARRTPAAAPARRRLLGARSRASLAPRPADRGAAPGVRDHHDARRPRSRAAGDRDRLGGPAGPTGRGWSADRRTRRRDARDACR